MSRFTPRDYQQQAKRSVLDMFRTSDSTLVEMPTGCGKTILFASLADDWAAGRTLVLAHTKELVEQARKKIYQFTGEMPSVEMASNYANEAPWCRSRIVVASKDSLHEKRLKSPGRFQDIGLLVIDEAHRAAEVNESYQHIIRHLREKNPKLKVLGVTATPKRSDDVALGLTFETCAFQYSIAEAVRDGWLVPAVANCIKIASLDLSGVDVTKSGEFNQKQLAAVLEQEKTLLEIADVAYREGADRLKTLIFANFVNEAEALANILADRYAVKSSWVCGDKKRVSDEVREQRLIKFGAGELTCLSNVAVLCEGYDEPGIQHLVMASPTKSQSRYAQQFGRGTRPLPGLVDIPGMTADDRRAAIAASAKPHILVTDLVDNSLKHKVVSVADVLGGNYSPKVVERAKEKINAKSGGGEPADSADALHVDAALEAASLEVAAEEETAKQERERQKKLREARELIERERRRHIRGEAVYETVAVDPISGSNRAAGSPAKKETTARMTFGEHKGKLVLDVPTDYLRWAEKKLKLPGWLNGAIKKELRTRAEFAQQRKQQSQAGGKPSQTPAANGQANLRTPASKAPAGRPEGVKLPPLPASSLPTNSLPTQCTPRQAAVLARYGHPTNVSFAEARKRIDQIRRELSQKIAATV